MKLRTFLNEIGNRITRSQRDSGMLIKVTSEGYSLHSRQKLIENLIWNEVFSIVAYKRDFLTEDQICIRFQCGDAVHEVNEDMEGFDSLTSMLPEVFPDILPEWREAVVQPAFAPQVTLLWKRNPL